jgi:hypothetical protein
MESTPSYFYFIYTPRRYKLQINNSSVLIFTNYGIPSLIKAVILGAKADKRLSPAEFVEGLRGKI